jgi:formylglycine-generating enzyme required for sulfatase activity
MSDVFIRKPGDAFRDKLSDGSEGPEMVVIPAGTFMMGSPDSESDRYDDEGPVHEVTIARAFALGRHPLTFEEYDRFCVATGREHPGDEDWGRGRLPLINASWDDAVAYCAWLSTETGRAYRLPSEAEWEYACRAGTTTIRWWGDEVGEDRANFGNWGNEWGGKQTSLVDAFAANPFGLNDMLGNVHEWVQDCSHDNYEGAPADGSAWLEASGGDCGRRVIRGGSWFDRPWLVRSANRLRHTPSHRSGLIGFRLAQNRD